jgi:hypothetical protein
MNACTAMPVTIPLQRPLWRRVAEWAAEHLAGSSGARHATGLAVEPMNLRNALALNDHLLRDIGVSETLRDEAAARRGIERMAAHIAQQDFAQRGRQWYG